MYFWCGTIKNLYHPNAYLHKVKNVKSGLRARSKILVALDKQPASAASVATSVKMSYNAAIHHLRLLEAEGTVQRKGKRPCVWLLTGLGQKRLVA
jgi:predicted ArsR family transcriptional regulator